MNEKELMKRQAENLRKAQARALPAIERLRKEAEAAKRQAEKK